ncbi:cytosolic glyceraldehyde-3-phosphate dehydrogenase [Tanacetum coccineum]
MLVTGAPVTFTGVVTIVVTKLQNEASAFEYAVMRRSKMVQIFLVGCMMNLVAFQSELFESRGSLLLLCIDKFDSQDSEVAGLSPARDYVLPPLRRDWVGCSAKLPPCSEVDNGTGDNNLPSSVITVLSNDDLLMEILLRLPFISLHLFKAVSKRWFSLITFPNLTLTRSKIPSTDPSLGLLIVRDYSCQTVKYDFVSYDIRIPSKRSTVFTLGSEAPPGSVEIMQSYNGLFLCRIKPHNSYAYEYYVYNPTTKLFKMLPIESRIRSVKMAIDPTKSPYYKVIHVGPSSIETYCSETGNLSVCGDRFQGHYFTGFENGIYWNDAIHWLEFSYGRPYHCKLKIVNEHQVLTMQDFVTFDGKLHFQSELFEYRGSLLLLCIDKFDSQDLTIFELKYGYSEWSVKYVVNLDDLKMPFSNNEMISWMIKHCVCSIVLG